jgi:hypothetical protein
MLGQPCVFQVVESAEARLRAELARDRAALAEMERAAQTKGAGAAQGFALRNQPGSRPVQCRDGGVLWASGEGVLRDGSRV